MLRRGGCGGLRRLGLEGTSRSGQCISTRTTTTVKNGPEPTLIPQNEIPQPIKPIRRDENRQRQLVLPVIPFMPVKKRKDL